MWCAAVNHWCAWHAGTTKRNSKADQASHVIMLIAPIRHILSVTEMSGSLFVDQDCMLDVVDNSVKLTWSGSNTLMACTISLPAQMAALMRDTKLFGFGTIASVDIYLPAAAHAAGPDTKRRECLSTDKPLIETDESILSKCWFNRDYETTHFYQKTLKPKWSFWHFFRNPFCNFWISYQF
jgi:hypothetical protein